ncbi:MAG: phosphoadenosine phosphosulfate reductase family protein, partial [Porticoccus sp.]
MSENRLSTVDLDQKLSEQTPQEILSYALEQFDNIAISFSGAEDVVLIDMAYKVAPEKVQAFSLDTGRLHSETYRYI